MARLDYLTKMERLINLCLRKKISVRAGISPSTDGKKTIFLPPLPEKASKEDILLHENFAFHEKSHFMGKSDPEKYLKGKLQHTITNAFDDIRCERLQEKKYAGIKLERRDFYRMMYDKSPDRFLIGKEPSIHKFIYELVCYMIFKWRVEDIKADINIKASDELLEAFDKYIADLKPETFAQQTQEDTLCLAQKFYDRIKDLVKDELEKEMKKESERGKGDEKPDKSDDDNSEETESDGSDGPDDKSGDDSGDTTSDDKSSEKDKKEDEGKSTVGEPLDSGEDSGLTEEEKERLLKAVRRIMEKFEEIETPVIDPHEEARRAIEFKATHVDNLYMVDPAVEDVIKIAKESPQITADSLKQNGIKMLGVEGARMTKMFISQSHPRRIWNQYEGRFDMRSFLSDPMDKRKDIYTYRKPGQLDKAAVLFLIDLSGSMGRSRINTAYSILQGLLHYLDRGGVPTMAAGFTTIGSTANPVYRDIPVRIEILKTFEERFTSKVSRRCVPNLDIMQENSEYDAVAWAVPHLLKRTETKKVLIMIGDGSPLIGNITLNTKLSRAYKEYLDLCRKAGVITFGFGIKADLTRFFGKDYVRTDTANLGQDTVSKIKEALERRKV